MNQQNIYFDDPEDIQKVKAILTNLSLSDKERMVADYGGASFFLNCPFALNGLMNGDGEALHTIATHQSLQRRIIKDFEQPFEHALRDEHKAREAQLEN